MISLSLYGKPRIIVYNSHYFLGAYLAKNKDKHKKIIEEITDKNYLKQNTLILLFILHHTEDMSLIEGVLLNSMCAFDNIQEAMLDSKETKFILDIIQNLPKDIISDRPVDEERKKEREAKDLVESENRKTENHDYDGTVEGINDIYKILKNNEVFSQILRNHYGNLDKKFIREIIKTIIDSGLRLVKILLDEQQIYELVEFIHTRVPNGETNKIEDLCRFLCFIGVMKNIERIAYSISVKEIRELVTEVVSKNSTPAYEIVRYFSVLNAIEKFTKKEKKDFLDLYRRHKKNIFVQKVLSLRTQYYFNTHTVEHDVQQSVCSEIGIQYKPRMSRNGNHPKK